MALECLHPLKCLIVTSPCGPALDRLRRSYIAACEWHPLKLDEVCVFARLLGYLSDTREIDGSERAVAANNVSLAYFGGQLEVFLFFWPHLAA